MTRLTLPRGSRITLGREVRRGFDEGRSSAAGGVVVYGFDRADSAPPRYALVVGKRWGGAVTRNRVRRLLRESFRTLRPQLATGFDYILLPRGDLSTASMAQVRVWLGRAAQRAEERVRDPHSTPSTRGPRKRRRR